MNSTTQTYTLTLNEGFFARRNALDWLFAAFVAAGGAYALAVYAAHMDVYEKAILLLSAPALIWLGFFRLLAAATRSTVLPGKFLTMLSRLSPALTV